MKLESKTIKRLGIYVLYDAYGIVDDYIPFFLRDLIKNLTELIIISNCALTDESRAKLSLFSERIIERENIGYDAWAYKTGLEAIGFDNLSQFDEIALINDSIMGPLFPLSEVFSKMNSVDLDFWGITASFKESFDWSRCNPYGFFPPHIQTFFLVFRSSLTKSAVFNHFWRDLPEIKDYSQAVGKFETILTKRFEDAGYHWQAYVDTSEMNKEYENPLVFYPVELIENKRCPVFKTRSYTASYASVSETSAVRSANALHSYLKHHPNFDINLLEAHLLRTGNLRDLVDHLLLQLTIPTNALIRQSTKKKMKIALVAHIFFQNQIAEMLSYAKSIPAYADVYVTTDDETKKAEIARVFSELQCAHFECRIVQNRGRSESALLVGCADILDSYDLVCFVHDKKTSHAENPAIGDLFRYACLENTLGSGEYVSNIIQTFENHPKIGIICPPYPYFDGWKYSFDDLWTIYFPTVRQLSDKLKLTVPLSQKSQPIAPWGGCLWFRPEALKPLTSIGWRFEDFPEEPLNPKEPTLLHAIELIYCYAAQQAGFFTVVAKSDRYARISDISLQYYASIYADLNKNYASQDQRISSIPVSSFIRLKIRFALSRFFPTRLFSALIRIKRALFGPYDAPNED